MRFLFLFAVLVTFSACEDEKATVSLQVEVKNSQGHAVPGAIIKINELEVGKSDDDGIAKIEVKVGVQQSNRIEVTKDSRSYYYAPFYDSFVIQNESPEPIAIKATMYFVPKPEVADEDSDPPGEVAAPATSTEEAEGQQLAEIEKAPPEAVEEVKVETSEDTESRPNRREDERVVPLLNVADEKDSNGTQSKQEKAPELTVFTVHVYSAGQPLAQAAIYVGDETKGNLKEGCTTNSRGRCALKFPQDHVGRRSLVVSKSGFVTRTEELDLVHGGKLRFDLKRGIAIDIFAMESRYKYRSGIKNAKVFIKGQLVGATDAFGHLTHTFAGKKEDLIDIVIKAPGYLPSEYEADFVLSKPISIVRYFTPGQPRNVRMAVMKAQPAGRINEDEVRLFSGPLNQQLAEAINKHIFRTPAFEAVSHSRFQSLARESDQSLGDMLRTGWQESEVKGEVDALILPTVVLGESKSLELSVIDSRGKIVVAGKETLDHLTDSSAIDHAVAQIAAKLRRKFPFEGAITAKNGDVLGLNIGSEIGIELKVGDQLTVNGTQVGEYGHTQDVTEIATLTVTKVGPTNSSAQVSWLAPRAAVRIGDAVVFKGGQVNTADHQTTAYIRVTASERGRSSPISQANIYLNERWLGATDTAGRLYLDKETTTQRGMLRVVKRGYSEFNRELTLENRKSIDVKVEKRQAFLTLESEPSGAEVYVEGKLLGKTPLMTPVPIPSGFVKLEVRGPEGYKTFSKVLDLAQGAVDFTGGKRVLLEKDYKSIIASLRRAGRFMEAVEKLKAIPKDHSDYLQAQHQMGEIYLSQLGEPALAAGSFGNVTSDPMVQNFVDKRFIGSHINEGVALFETAERLRLQNTEVATAHYIKAAQVLGQVAAQLRFVPEDQYQKAANSVGYHHALALHKLWYQTKQPEYLNQAHKSWRKYLDSVAAQDDSSVTAMVDNARVFFKQAEADLQVAGKVQ